ncbi:GAF domain-containing protein [Nocardioides sp. DS6]|uniref:GAF domain-containing protein n=1 Tax=Nocardioides eburneus TaxID=3231482 RepID=A0ABV3SW08_9ACTN
MGEHHDEESRWQLLLDAVVTLAAELSLDDLLARITRIAGDLAGARYSALGVLGTDGRQRLRTFVTHGLSDEQIDEIGPPPAGHGLLGLIIDRPEPVRLSSIAGHPASYGFPVQHPPMTSFLGVPVLIRGKVFGNLYLTDKIEAPEFTESDERIVVALASAAGVAIENAQLHEEAVRRERWLQATAEVIARLVAGDIGTEALQLVADRARQLAEADLAWVLLGPDIERLSLCVVSGAELDNGGLVGQELATPLSARVITTGEPLVVDDLASEPTYAEVADALGWPSLGPVILLPLSSSAGTDGVVALGWAPERRARFHDLDPAMLGNFAEQASLALRIVSSAHDQQRLGLFEERDRIARDLHDVVIQRLFAIGLSLQGALRAPDGGEIARVVDAAVDGLDETIRDIRRTIFELGSTERADDAQSTVTRVVERAASALKFRPQLAFEGPVRTQIAPVLLPHLVAALSEMLSNVTRHAHAASASVLLRVADAITLRVEDDGLGVPDGVVESGLANLRQRAHELGGTCEVCPGEQGGTVVEWTVPLSPPGQVVPPPRRARDFGDAERSARPHEERRRH